MAHPIHSCEQLPEGLLSSSQMKRLERKQRKQLKQEPKNTSLPPNVHHIHEQQRRKPLNPLNETQKLLLQALRKSEQTLIFGPAGTGKTFVSVTYAADMFLEGKIKKIILTRPNTGVGKSIGFLPGTLEEKFAVWLAETIAILKNRLGEAIYDIALKKGAIEMVPLEYMRGRSFEDAFILGTEMQNATKEEVLALVTRVGENSKLVLDGDVRQCDIRSNNGLNWAKEMIEKNSDLQKYSSVVEFTINDVVRSGLCGAWVRAVWGETENGR